MFQFTWCSLICLCVQHMILKVNLSGFPHSDIPGSTSICDSPRHFGAYPVLLRLLVPRHSPYALISLTRNIIYCLFFNVHFFNSQLLECIFFAFLMATYGCLYDCLLLFLIVHCIRLNLVHYCSLS